jgi:arsenical pump membrane protein
MILALCVFISTLVLIMVRPKPLNEATAALLGALGMLVIGVVSPTQALEVLKANANILLFFLGLMLVSIVADRGGFFEWTAVRAITLANGNGRRLFLIIFGVGTAITAFFSNDATALILTPVVYVLVTRLRLSPLPYVFACAFIANTASMLLPVSNPVNLLPVDKFGLTLAEYLRFLLAPALLAIAINIVLFTIIFRKDITGSFNNGGLDYGVKVDAFFRFVCIGIAITAVGYILASIYGLPLSWPALAGASILLIGGFSFRRISLSTVASRISWSILLFIFSLALLVKGLENAGITHILGGALVWLSTKGTLEAIIATTVATGLGSNLINNWSMMMVSVSSLASASNPVASFHQSLIYSSVLGADLGPNIAILGSLSSMLWLVLLRQRGFDIHPLQYLKLGLIVTPPMLIASALALYASSVFWS